MTTKAANDIANRAVKLSGETLKEVLIKALGGAEYRIEVAPHAKLSDYFEILDRHVTNAERSAAEIAVQRQAGAADAASV